MSFISIDAEAQGFTDRAKNAGLFAASARLYGGNRKGVSARFKQQSIPWLAVAIICVLMTSIVTLAVSKGFLTSLLPADLAAELHPSCSPDHDCWITAPRKLEQSARAPDQMVAQAPIHEDGPDAPIVAPRMPRLPGVDAHEDMNVSRPFGQLVKPETNWSGPPLAPKLYKSVSMLSKSAPIVAVPHPTKKLRTAARTTAAGKPHVISD